MNQIQIQEEREQKAKEVAEKLGLQYLGHIINIGVSYFKFQAPSFVGSVYEPDMDYIYDLVFGLNSCAEYSIERRQRNLECEFTRSGWFLVGSITIKLNEVKNQ